MNTLKGPIAIVLTLIIILMGAGYWYSTSKTNNSSDTVATNTLAKKHKIIIVNPGGATYAQLFKGFEEALRVSYPESASSLTIVTKNAAGSQQKLKDMITEAVSENPTMIVTASSPPTLQALDETKVSKIPILSVLGDPTKHGYIPSLQSSGTNLTGIAQQSIELTPKRFEILKRMFPKTKRVAVFYDTTCGPTKEARPIANAAAPQLGLTLVEFPLTSPTRDQVKQALKVINAKDFDAVIFYPHGTLFSKSDLFLAATKEAKVPIIMPDETSLADGAVASFGPDFFLTGKQLTRLAIKVLNGVDPKDIPLEPAEDVRFVVSLKSLKDLGKEIPDEVIDQVDKVIKVE